MSTAFWTCDVCNVKSFLEYKEACDHEATCTGVGGGSSSSSSSSPESLPSTATTASSAVEAEVEVPSAAAVVQNIDCEVANYLKALPRHWPTNPTNIILDFSISRHLNLTRFSDKDKDKDVEEEDGASNDDDAVPIFRNFISIVNCWRTLARILPPEDDFNEATFRGTLIARDYAYIVALNLLRKGRKDDAIMMFSYGAFLEEFLHRGADYMNEFFNCKKSEDFSYVADTFHHFGVTVACSQRHGNMIQYFLKNYYTGFAHPEHAQIATYLQQELVKMPEYLHQYLDSWMKNHREQTRIDDITVTCADYGTKTKGTTYSDVQLNWWFKTRTLRCSIKGIPANKYTYLTVRGEVHFLHDSSDRTLSQLGISDGTEILMGSQIEPATCACDIDIDWHWKRINQWMNIKDFISGSVKEITEASVICLFRRVAEAFPADKDFDVSSYKKAQHAKSSSYIMSAYFLLNGRYKHAACLILYAAIVDDLLERGPDDLKSFWEYELSISMTKRGEDSVMCITSRYLQIRDAVDDIRYWEHMIRHLRLCLPSFGVGNMRTSFSDILGRLEKQEKVYAYSCCQKLHTLTSYEEWKEMIPLGPKISVTTANADNGRSYTRSFYHDTSLGWLVKLYVMICNYHPIMRSGEVNDNTKYFRVLHRSKPLFLSTNGKMTLKSLDTTAGYLTITVGGVSSLSNESSAISSPSRHHTTQRRKKVHGKGKKKKKRATAPPVLSEEQLQEKYRQEHSKAMTPVFEELEPVLKGIRNHLNDLTIQKNPPKKKRPTAKKKSDTVLESFASLSMDDSTSGKAGKVAYPVLVGEKSNLYKTFKSPKSTLLTIDLHGCTSDEALAKLEHSLPLWMDTAMKGEYPWVVPVDIVCGGGSQTLSEVVRKWIRSNSQVANRPKGFI